MKVLRCEPINENAASIGWLKGHNGGWANVYRWGYGGCWDERKPPGGDNLLYRIRVIPKVKDKEALR